jgi:sterol desaturase/sphingolipid hydroxylase (fatty acid hydroxylase superfamily)
MSSEIAIRLECFFGTFVVVAICEVLAPRRALTTPKARRWVANLVFIALNPLSVRLVFPVLPVGMALLASQHQWGLLNNVDLPCWLEAAIGVIVLDLSVYLQHVLHHAVPGLWRLPPGAPRRSRL